MLLGTDAQSRPQTAALSDSFAGAALRRQRTSLARRSRRAAPRPPEALVSRPPTGRPRRRTPRRSTRCQSDARSRARSSPRHRQKRRQTDHVETFSVLPPPPRSGHCSTSGQCDPSGSRRWTACRRRHHAHLRRARARARVQAQVTAPRSAPRRRSLILRASMRSYMRASPASQIGDFALIRLHVSTLGLHLVLRRLRAVPRPMTLLAAPKTSSLGPGDVALRVQRSQIRYRARSRPKCRPTCPGSSSPPSPRRS